VRGGQWGNCLIFAFSFSHANQNSLGLSNRLVTWGSRYMEIERRAAKYISVSISDRIYGIPRPSIGGLLRAPFIASSFPHLGHLMSAGLGAYRMNNGYALEYTLCATSRVAHRASGLPLPSALAASEAYSSKNKCS
jgi:hypothetical protein